MVDATNSLLYKLVLNDAPYVIAAYAVLWLALAGYVTVTLRRLVKLDKEVTLLEDAVATKINGKAQAASVAVPAAAQMPAAAPNPDSDPGDHA